MDPTPPIPPDYSSSEALTDPVTLLNELPWGVLVLDAQGVIRRANQQAVRWSGAAPEALLGRPVAALGLPDGLVAALLPATGPAEVTQEAWLPGTSQWVSFRATRQPAGGWVVYGHDITPQKQREQQYQALAENTPDVLTRWTPDLRLRYANAAFAAQARQPVAAVLGRTIFELGLPAEVSEPYAAALRRVFATGQPQEHTHAFDAPWGPVQYYVRLVPELHDGEIETVLGIGRDITRLKQAEAKALRASEAQFRAVANLVPDLLWRSSPDNETTWYNQRWHAYTGQTLDEAAGHGWANVIHPDDQAESSRRYRAAVASGQPLRLEHRLRSAQGAYRWFQVQAEPLRNEQGEISAWFGAATDIHERKQQEQHQAFLLHLSDALRAERGPDAVGRAATRLLAQYLGVDRCHIIRIARPQQLGWVGPEYHAPELPDLAGEYRFADFPEAMHRLETEPLIIQDLWHDASLTEADKHSIEAMGMHAALTCALRQGTRDSIWALNVGTRHPRPWSANDQRLVEETAERTWAALERARAEEALRQVQENLQIAVEAAEMGTWDLDLTNDFSGRRSLRHDQVFGYDAPQPTWGQEIARRHVLAEDLAVFDAGFARALATGEMRFEVRTRWPDGSLHWMACHGRFYFDDAGRPVRGAGVNFDITARKQTEEALRASELKYRTLFDSIDEGVALEELVYDANGEIADIIFREVNQAYERQGGLTNVVGKSLREVLPHLEEYWKDVYAQVARTGEPVRLVNYAQDVGRWFDTYITPLAGDRQHIAVVFNDITERKQRELSTALLDEIGQDLAILSAPDEIMQTVGRRLGEFLDLSGCYFVDVDEAQNEVSVHYGWASGNVPSLMQTFQLKEYLSEDFLHTMRAGAVFVLRDTAQDSRAEAKSYALLKIGSFVTVPFFRQGRYVGHIAVTTERAHAWQPPEIQLLQEVSSRIFPRIERARVEEALRLSEERFRLAEEASKGFVYDWNAQDDTVTRSVGYRQVLGYAPGAVPDTVGAWQDLIHPDDRAVAARLPTPTAEAVTNEYRVRRPDGTYAYVFDRSRSIRDAAGQLVRIVGSVVDVSEQRQAEEALRASEEKLGLFVTATSDAVYELSADMRQLYQLDGQHFIASIDEPSSDWVAAYIPADEQPRVQAAIAQAIQTRSALELEHRVNQLDGTVGWAFTRAIPVLTAAGDIRHWFGAARDTTELKRAEEALRQAEAHYRQQLEQQVAERTQQLQENRDLVQSVLDSGLVAVAVFQTVRTATGAVEDFTFVLVNKAQERMSDRRDLVGQRYAQVYPGIRQTGIWQQLLHVVATGQPQQGEVYYPYENLHRWYEYQFVALGDGVVATTLDITARKQAEAERLRNLNLLEQAETVAGLGSWDYNSLTGEFRWSDGMYQLFGLPLGQPVSPDIYLRFVVAEDRPQVERLVARLAAGSDSFEETLRLQVGEQVKTVRIKAVVLRDEAGQSVRVLGVDLDITELQRLEADNLRLRLTQQQALFEAVQEAQEEERRRMSESLHNSIGQILYATKLQLERLPAEADDDSPRQRAAELLSQAIRQTRTLSHELTPATLQEFGLEVTLHSMCTTISSPALRWHCHFVFDEGPTLSAPLQLAVYRLAQELVQNVLKHARATTATLEVEVLPAWVVLRVEDNGQGFDPTQTSDGLGLRSLRSRAALLKGHVQVTTTPGQGTQCQVRLPLTPTNL